MATDYNPGTCTLQSLPFIMNLGMMNYKMDFDDHQKDYDKIFESNGLKVVCDLKSWLYLKNITIDYSDDMLNGGFKIENPNAERTCGCGTSFSA